MWDGSLGRIRATEHSIELKPGNRPFRLPPYRAGPKAREMEDAEIQRMLAEGVIRRSSSEWASPVVIAPQTRRVVSFLRRLPAG